MDFYCQLCLFVSRLFVPLYLVSLSLCFSFALSLCLFVSLSLCLFPDKNLPAVCPSLSTHTPTQIKFNKVRLLLRLLHFYKYRLRRGPICLLKIPALGYQWYIHMYTLSNLCFKRKLAGKLVWISKFGLYIKTGHINLALTYGMALLT